MTEETIVAAFERAADAQAAAQDLEAAGIPATSITQHGTGSFDRVTPSTGSVAPRKEPGFWARLFGSEDDDYAPSAGTAHDHAVYDRTIQGGGTVLSIKIADVEREGDLVLNVLDKHNPVDVEERAASYSSSTASAAYASPNTAVGEAGNAQRVQLAEEALVVGKRVVNRGTTRIRRYVVETPVSEDVSLHRETVSVERRPVSSDGAVAADAFTDRAIEMIEMNEEVVVGKTARVVEEVVIRKDSSDRVETVHDTVRREELEVDKTVEAGADASVRPIKR